MTTRTLTGLALALVVALGVTGVTGAATSAKKQLVSIDQEERPDLRNGKWEMLVWTPGPVQDDKGTYTWSVTSRKKGVRGGQAFERVLSIVAFTGKNGTFKVREDDTLVSSRRGKVATGTWTMLSGTEDYAGVNGGGRPAAAVGLVRPDPWRYEGFLAAP